MSNAEMIFVLCAVVALLAAGAGWEIQRLKDRVKELEIRNVMRGEAPPLKD